jgi:hypothetical protein
LIKEKSSPGGGTMTSIIHPSTTRRGIIDRGNAVENERLGEELKGEWSKAAGAGCSEKS